MDAPCASVSMCGLRVRRAWRAATISGFTVQFDLWHKLLEQRPDLKPEDLATTRKFMDSAFEDYEALVTGYEHRIESLSLPDPDDRHVLAAAIECGASIIVTANLKDFPDSQLKQSGGVANHSRFGGH